jgi:carbamoyltransferase
VQQLYEKKFLELLKYTTKKNLIIMGGCALNCVANSKIPKDYNVWIMPSPGDAGSSLGAAALINGVRLNWRHPYLGHNIAKSISPKQVVNHLLEHKYCGIANGRAEFGPRALGNRSLIADPRLDIKNTINQIKQRQKYRPFAPMILEEYFDEYFHGRKNRYMQFVSKALHDYKSVTHVDGTARVQVVERSNPSVARLILEEWYEKTGCPMLLNTSLNIKGQPIVNTWDDAIDFQREYNVKVF